MDAETSGGAVPTPSWTGSPHKRRGRAGRRPEAVVVHLMDGTLRGTDEWFQDAASRVSAHYGVGRAGQVHQYVLEADTAFHAGRVYQPTWSGIRTGVSPNLYTVGIEHEGRLGDAWPEAMMEASAALIADVCRRWSIPIDRAHVVGHREIYARKACPGDRVDLDRLVRMARAVSGLGDPADAPPLYNFVASAEPVTTRVRLNVRAAPTSQAARLRTERQGAVLGTSGWTSNGETVSGNAHWYRLADGWVWAGGTQAPVPMLDAPP